MEVMSRKTEYKWRVGWGRRMPYVQFRKLLGSRTQRSTEEAGEQEDMSTSAEPVEILAKDVTERNSGTGGRGPYAVTGSCVVSTWPECAGEHMLIM